MAYTKAQADAFIAKIAPLIQKEATLRGYKSCAAVVAQAIIEGAAGTSALAAKYNNHFGLKAGSAWMKAGKPAVNMKTKEEYTPGKLVSINDYFRAYANMEDGVKGYYDFISTARYANLKTAADYKTYATFLKNDGYATSSSYINTLCNTVVKYNLTMYDKGSMPTLRVGSTGEAVRNLQQILTYMGYTLKIDGIFGAKTKEAVMAFQASQDIGVDGIVGAQTWSKLIL